MMKIFEIEKLIADYYEGKTSVEEEKELKRFFETQEVPPHLLADKKLFQEMYNDCNETEVPPHLEQKLSHLIDTWAEEEKTIRPHQKKKVINWQWISGVAASICIILSIGLYPYLEQEKPTLTDTYSNPQDAYKEAQKALLLVSNNLNKGVSQMENARKDMNKVNKILNEQLYQ